MSPMTIMDSLARERERAAREGQRIVDAKKAHFVTEQRRGTAESEVGSHPRDLGNQLAQHIALDPFPKAHPFIAHRQMLSLGIQLLPNLAIRRPVRSASSPRSELHSDRARSDRLKVSSIKHAQTWLNRAKAKTQATLDANGSATAAATKDTPARASGTNGSVDAASKTGRPSTLADFVAASRGGAGAAPVSTHVDGPGISLDSGTSWGSTKLPISTANTVNVPGAAPSAVADRDPTADTARKRPRFTRSTAGCLGCRKQKVRCDESKPACLKCIAAERECIWPPEGGRKRRKRGTVGMGSSKDKGESYALSQIKTESKDGQDRTAEEGGREGGARMTKDRSESGSQSASGSGSFGLGIKPKTSMARQTSGLGGASSGSGGSSDDERGEDDEDEDQDDRPAFGGTAHPPSYNPPLQGQEGYRTVNTANANLTLDPRLTNPSSQPPTIFPEPTSSFDLSSTDWDFTNHLHGFGGDSTHGRAGADGGVQTVLDMGLNSATGATNTHSGGMAGGGNDYMRSQSLGDGPNSGANEILGPHSMPTPNMPTPSSVHSQSGIGMGMSGSQPHIPFMTDSPILASPTNSTNIHSLIHPSSIGMPNPHLHASSHPASGSNTAANTSTVGVFDYNAASGRQGTVSPSQLLLPRTSAGPSGGIGGGPSLMTGSSGTAIGVGGGAVINVPASALSPPQLIDLSKSTLLAKRKDKAKFGSASNAVQDNSSGQLMDVTPASLRMAMVEMILHFDEGLFEFGPSHRTRNLLNTLTTPINTDFLSLAFPSPAARLLFHHYCNVTSRLLITMGNVGPNPLLALCTPLKLLDTASAWAGAIRMSILSISATHFAHETEASVGKEVLGEEWEGKRVRLKELSRKFKKAALCNVYLGTGGDDPQQIDSILAACTLLCIRDVIDADETWQDNLEFALHMISKRGGPLAMLKAADTSFTRRYLLENLAVHDVFGCFITGKEPALLGNYDPWWFDSVDSSTTRWEWESVEQTFGISRTVVDLLARIAALDSRKRRLEINLARNPEEMNDVGQYIYRECQNLLFELDILGNSLSALPQHVRVTCGDYIYKYTAAVYVLADILEEPTSTPRIVRDVASILELCSEASAMRMSVMLIWPLLIAGTFCLPDVRPKVEELFDVFEPYYAEDLPAARLLLREQWKGMDEGKGKRSWREVMKAANKFVLLI